MVVLHLSAAHQGRWWFGGTSKRINRWATFLKGHNLESWKNNFIINIVFPWLPPSPLCWRQSRAAPCPDSTVYILTSTCSSKHNTFPSMASPYATSSNSLSRCPPLSLSLPNPSSLTSWPPDSFITAHTAPVADRMLLYTLIKTWQGFPQCDGEESACLWEVLKNGKYYYYDNSQRLFSGFSF